MRWRFWRGRREPPTRLKYLTGADEVEWVKWIQAKISATWRPNPRDSKHPISLPGEDWIVPLVYEVDRRYKLQALKNKRQGGDNNIGTAQVVAYILAVWSGRIARAKAMDPRRPIKLRRGAYQAWHEFIRWMMSGLISEELDPEMFDQPWESPYLPDAADGDFV